MSHGAHRTTTVIRPAPIAVHPCGLLTGSPERHVPPLSWHQYGHDTQPSRLALGDPCHLGNVPKLGYWDFVGSISTRAHGLVWDVHGRRCESLIDPTPFRSMPIQRFVPSPWQSSGHDMYFVIYIALKGSIPKPASRQYGPTARHAGPLGRERPSPGSEAFSQGLRRPRWLHVPPAPHSDLSPTSLVPLRRRVLKVSER